ncbi:MAG: endonuclease domain-containing protein [Bacteroidales bacterium]
MRKPRKKSATKRTTSRRRIVYNFIYDKDKWVKGSAQIKKHREMLIENAPESSCMASGLHFSSEGLQGYTLDHSHDTGVVRGVLRADTNIFLGRVEKYYNKILGKTGLSLIQVLEGLLNYLKSSEKARQSGNYMLDFRTVEAELKRVSRWKTETIFNKLKNKLELLPVEGYTRQQVVEMYINQFIKYKEENK